MNKALLCASATAALFTASVQFAEARYDNPEVFTDMFKCDRYATQYDGALHLASDVQIAQARDLAAQGGALCSYGKWEEGSGKLARAIELLGQTPSDN